MPQDTHPVATDSSVPGTRTSTAPVFVVGCPRSGTTLLYHMLLSAGNFAIYRAESEVFHLLEPRFGDLSVAANKKRLLKAWFPSRLFKATGLEAHQIEEKIMRQCRNSGDFLKIVMEEMARQQGVQRWADCTPDHVLYLPRIKQTIPDALIIHIIRDGRDVALSMEKQGWPQQLPWDHEPRRMSGALYWEWMTRKGQEDGARLGPDYMEVRYEELTTKPHETLQRLSGFVGQELDYDKIRQVGIGSVSRPNTSFQEESGFIPVGRWKKNYSPEQAAVCEGLVGETLQKLGYELSAREQNLSLRWRLFRAQYRASLVSKQYVRTRTPLGRVLMSRDLPKA